MVPDYGKVWYYDKSIADIFSLFNLVEKYRVAYDSHQDDAYNFHTNRGIINIRRNKQGVYVFKTNYTTENSNVVATLKQSMMGFTSRQIDRSKLAIKIYSNVWLPTLKNVSHVVSTNMISNSPISVADIINDKKTYGPLMESLKGNSIRIKPRPVIKNDIQIPS